MVDGGAVHCGNCGAPLARGATFCGRCGRPVAASFLPQPAPAPPSPVIAYQYPVVSEAGVPRLRRKVSPLVFGVAAASAVAVVAALTFALVQSKPSSASFCHFSCIRPRPGVTLIGSTLYTNAKYGFSVEYVTSVPGGSASITDQNADGAAWTLSNGAQDVFRGARGTTDTAAIQAAVAGLNTSTFRDLQPMGAVRGAEIGLVLGNGLVYYGDYFPPGGGQAMKVGVIAMAATRGNLTISVLAVSQLTSDTQEAPYELRDGAILDFPITLAHFPAS